MEFAVRVFTYALIPVAVLLTFRWLAKRFPAPQASAQPSPQTRVAAPKGYNVFALAVVFGGFIVATISSLGFASLSQRLAERGDCTVACFGGSFAVWLLPWLFAGFVIVGLVGEAIVTRTAPGVLEEWRRFDAARTGVNWESLGKPMYIAIAILTTVVTLLGLRYSVRFGASETEMRQFFAPGVIRLPHGELDSIVAYDCVRLRNGGCKPQRGIAITWKSGTRLGSRSALYGWRPGDYVRLAKDLARQTGAKLRVGGEMPR